MQITHDAPLWYNVPEWSKFGLAVPNWSNNVATQNGTIRMFVEIVGRNLQSVMFHTDARMRTPPSINTLIAVHKMVLRIRGFLAGRAIPSSTPNMEALHVAPAPEEFIVFPTPYFLTPNRFMKEWCGLALSALAEAMQHTENARPIEISTNFAGDCGQYFHRIYRMMATELLMVPLAEAEKPDFTLTEQQLTSYKPEQWFPRTEMIDNVAPFEEQPTEDLAKILTDGIPISRLPPLPRWPAGVVGPTGTTSAAAAANPSQSSFVVNNPLATA